MVVFLYVKLSEGNHLNLPVIIWVLVLFMVIKSTSFARQRPAAKRPSRTCDAPKKCWTLVISRAGGVCPKLWGYGQLLCVRVCVCVCHCVTIISTTCTPAHIVRNNTKQCRYHASPFNTGWHLCGDAFPMALLFLHGYRMSWVSGTEQKLWKLNTHAHAIALCLYYMIRFIKKWLQQVATILQLWRHSRNKKL